MNVNAEEVFSAVTMEVEGCRGIDKYFEGKNM